MREVDFQITVQARAARLLENMIQAFPVFTFEKKSFIMDVTMADRDTPCPLFFGREH